MLGVVLPNTQWIKNISSAATKAQQRSDKQTKSHEMNNRNS